VQCEIITEVSDESWESKRDSVEVVTSDGKQLARHADMQHNKNYSSLKDNCSKIVQETLQALGL
jgi:hypothetical protein